MLSHQSENQVDHMEKYDDNDDDSEFHNYLSWYEDDGDE